jgi:uncharacterized membrane protein YhhN
VILIAAALALAYLPLAPRASGPLRSAIKTLAVALLALAAALAQAPVLLTLALGLCALGDLLLSRDSDRAFMAGIAAFAAGHLAYIALFLRHPLSEASRLLQAPQLWIALALIGLGVVLAIRLFPRAGNLRLPVLAYLPIILGMGLATLTLPAMVPLIWLLPSALAFIASDLVLAVEKFLLPPNHPALRFTPYVVWPLYWGAQARFLQALI